MQFSGARPARRRSPARYGPRTRRTASHMHLRSDEYPGELGHDARTQDRRRLAPVTFFDVFGPRRKAPSPGGGRLSGALTATEGRGRERARSHRPGTHSDNPRLATRSRRVGPELGWGRRLAGFAWRLVSTHEPSLLSARRENATTRRSGPFIGGDGFDRISRHNTRRSTCGRVATIGEARRVDAPHSRVARGTSRPSPPTDAHGPCAAVNALPTRASESARRLASCTTRIASATRMRISAPGRGTALSGCRCRGRRGRDRSARCCCGWTTGEANRTYGACRTFADSSLESMTVQVCFRYDRPCPVRHDVHLVPVRLHELRLPQAPVAVLDEVHGRAQKPNAIQARLDDPKRFALLLLGDGFIPE